MIPSDYSDATSYTVIEIVYGDPDVDCLKVFINGREIKDLKAFSIEARDNALPTYKLSLIHI